MTEPAAGIREKPEKARELIGETQSLCPVCLSRIPANRVSENGNVYLEKACPEHGSYKILIWRRDGKHYLDWERYGEEPVGPLKRLTQSIKGCPYDCGLCPDHKQNACTMVIEVTQGCNLNCPICFAGAHKEKNIYYDLDLKTIGELYKTVWDTVGDCTLQLSGGEPTIRDDLPRIVSLAQETGFSHILVNTNGIRIARDKGYLESLKNGGASAIYLQFDGVTDDVYRFIRGANLFDLKVQAISNCAEARIGVVLVPTIIPKVNDHQLGDIFRFAKKWIPVVKGIHFQPVSYMGRYPKIPKDDDRITIPDVLDGLVVQSGGEVKLDNFLPRRPKDSHCSFSSFFILMENGRLMATSNLAHELAIGWSYTKRPPAEQARLFMSRHWRFTEGESKPGSGPSFFQRAQTHCLTITGMPFQDIWNVDLERLQACCGHVALPDRRIMPFCSYYLTSINGQRLHSPPNYTVRKC